MVISRKRKKYSAIKDSPADKVFLGFVYAFLVGALLITMYPLIYILSASISDPNYVNSGAMWLLPKGITFEGYRLIFANQQIWQGYANTIIYTILGTAINLMVTIPCAYALARPEFKGKKFFMTFIMITMFVSGGLIPTFQLVVRMGMLDTIWAIILPGATSVFNIVVTRTFFQSTIPREMEEAAIIDGCSDIAMFFKIILPLSLPIIAVMALFFGVGHWNSWFGALIYLNDRTMFPLQLILREILVMQEMASMPEPGTMDATTAAFMHTRQQLSQVIRYGVMIVSTLPIIMIYPFLQKYFVKGVMIGSLKG
ncbi:MAG: carbohydrate ABC transporter permease [Turicibacter sp.]|nr:carbohydrate ABC transporter permease [Turicibacter sp.]